MNMNPNFCEVVKSEFAFLIRENAFQISRESVEAPIEYVEYQTDLVYVRVVLTGPDYEPKLVFGRNKTEGIDDNESYNWVDLKELDCCKFWTWKSNPNKPYDGRVSELARLLKDCGQSCIRGDSTVYTLMGKRREELRGLHLLEEKYVVAKCEAQHAWEEKRYRDYVTLLGEYLESLSSVDRSRFEFAQKKCEIGCH